MKRRRTGDDANGGAPQWVLTYGDMMSLLLCFFIAIVSFSTIEVARYRAALGSFRGALQSPFSTIKTPTPTPTSALSESMMEAQEAVETAAEVSKLVEAVDVAAGVEVEITPEGVRVTLSNPVLFDEGKDELKPGAVKFLAGLARVIRKREPPGVLIEGHTDDTPIRNLRFPSNWELSAARALVVLRLFQSEGVPPGKLVAVGYGEYRPKAALPKDASRDQKGVNRRVEILLQTRPTNGASSARGAGAPETGWGE